MKAPNSKQWGFKGTVEKENTTLRKGKRGKVLGTLCNNIPNIDSNKYARVYLSNEEYQRRMIRYAIRAQKRLPLFDKSRKKYPEKKGEIVCGGCGKESPKRSYIASIGWSVELILWYGESIGRLTVCWCPKCSQENRNARSNGDEVYQ